MGRQLRALGETLPAGDALAAAGVVKVEIPIPGSDDTLKMKLEAESKHALPQSAAAPLAAAIQEAERTGLPALLRRADRRRFEGFRLVSKLFAGEVAADDESVYFDDDAGTLFTTGASLSTRIVPGGAWRVVAKLPPVGIADSAVLVRVEITRKLGAPRDGDALPLGGDGFDPVELLARAVPGVERSSLSRRLAIKDVRRKYDIFDADDSPAYVLTVDHAHATDFQRGTRAWFSEVEIERNDGSVAPTALRELVAISKALAAQALLRPVADTKPQRARRLLAER